MDLAALPCSSGSVGPANQLFGLLLQTIFAKQCALSPDWPQDTGQLAPDLPEYDFIVVGAGTAGSVVANRLSENGNWNVLLLEAGPDPPVEFEIPELISLVLNTPYDWGYYAEQSTYAALNQINGTHLLAGKMLGGSSTLSHGVYIRGLPQDYNGWADAGWNWENVLKYFKKSEDQKVARIAADKKYHAVGGYLPVDYFHYQGNVKNVLEDSFADIGFKQVVDINADKHIGYVVVEGNVREGKKISSAEAFLVPVRNRTNLNLIKNARVTNVNYNQDGSVGGVNFLLNGQKTTAKSKKEVILSAGTLNSPLILLNSGIGPANELAKFDIPIVKDLPVGHNLQDHFFVPLLLTFRKPLEQPVSLIAQASNYYRYLMKGKGDFSNVGVLELDLFFNTELAANYPNIQLEITYFGQNTQSLGYYFETFGFSQSVVDSIVETNQQGDNVLLIVTYLQPKSKGILELRSNNTLDPPIIHTNYLKDPQDLRDIVRAIRRLQTLNYSETFLANKGEISKIPLVECDGLPENSDEYWACYCRQLTSSAYHYVGTNKMGVDRSAVVDPRLRVRGVRRLRVIDSSIMPQIIHGNTNAAAIMIGEKGADFVKEDWTKLPEFSRFKNLNTI